MSHQLVKSCPVCRVQHEHTADEVSGLLGYHQFGETEVANLDPFVGEFDFVCFEWRFPEEKSVSDDSCAPDVDFVGMSLLAFVAAVVL